jgi:hypothetical protein
MRMTGVLQVIDSAAFAKVSETREFLSQMYMCGGRVRTRMRVYFASSQFLAFRFLNKLRAWGNSPLCLTILDFSMPWNDRSTMNMIIATLEKNVRNGPIGILHQRCLD